MHAAALNFSDLLMIRGAYQIRPPVPFVPGQELSGTIVSTGPGSRLRPGERVASKVLWGAFAEYALAREDMLIRLPDDLSFEAGATLPVVWPTAWIALFDRARIQAGEFVLVHAAAGGLGCAAVQLCRHAGARVVAGVGDAEKAVACRDAGADLVVITRESGWSDRVMEFSGGRGVDVVVDPVGGEITDRSLKCLARDGRLLIVGFASGKIPRIRANRLLLRNASALGVYWSHETDRELVERAVADVLRLHQAGSIEIAAHRKYALTDLRRALADLDERRTIGKSVIVAIECEECT